MKPSAARRGERLNHIALIAWAYPPSSATGGLRALAMSRWLVERGHRVTVIAAPPVSYEAFFQTDESLVGYVPDSVEVRAASFTPESMNPLLNSWPTARVRDNSRWTRTWQENTSVIFPELTYPVWIASALAELCDLHDRDPVSLTIATAAPYSAFAVASQFNEYSGVPFVLDDRDSFLLDVFTAEPLSDFDRRRDLFVEFLSRASNYWVVNEAIAASFRRITPAADKIRVVPNGWDSFSMPEVAGRGSDDPVFVFVGTLTRTFPADLVAAAWRIFRNSNPTARLLMVGGIGYGNSISTPASQILAETPGVELMGRVNRRRLGEIYGQASVLLFAKEGGPLVTSSKIYEYVATGLPIAALGTPDLGTREEMAGYSLVHWGDLTNPASGSVAMELALADASVRRTQGVAPQAAHRFERSAAFSRTAGPFMDQVVAP